MSYRSNTPGQTNTPGFFESRHAHLPQGTGVFGMWLFLATLSILFAASIAGYLIVRLVTLNPVTDPVTGEITRLAGPALGSIDIPLGLWVSTALMLASSVTIHRALRAVRQERQADFRRGLIATAVLAVVFLAVQMPSLIELLGEHQQYRLQLREQINLGEQARMGLQPYGMVFFLIVVHAAHLLGGIIPLGVITRNALRSHYDHESHNPVRYTAMYWHFLDAVWLTLFAMFLLVG